MNDKKATPDDYITGLKNALRFHQSQVDKYNLAIHAFEEDYKAGVMMAENKMGKIAQRFGKKLGEYFKIKDDVNNSIYSFESCGVVWWQSGKNGNSLIIMDNILADLMTGRKEIEHGQSD